MVYNFFYNVYNDFKINLIVLVFHLKILKTDAKKCASSLQNNVPGS